MFLAPESGVSSNDPAAALAILKVFSHATFASVVVLAVHAPIAHVEKTKQSAVCEITYQIQKVKAPKRVNVASHRKYLYPLFCLEALLLFLRYQFGPLPIQYRLPSNLLSF